MLSLLATVLFALQIMPAQALDIDSIPEGPKLEATAAPKGAPNPCANIKLNYFERVEAQGFLGLSTPKASRAIVAQALTDNVTIAWKAFALRNHDPGTLTAELDRTQATIPDEYGIRDPLLLMGFDFKLYELCTLAGKRGIQRLTFACRSDTHTRDTESPDKPTGTFGTVKTSDSLSSECLISTYSGSARSWDRYKQYVWGEVQNNSQRELEAGSIDDPHSRELEYFRLFRGLVNEATEH